MLKKKFLVRGVFLPFILSSSIANAGFDSVRLAYGYSITKNIEMSEIRLAARWQLMDFSDDQRGWQHRLLLDTVYTQWDSKLGSSDVKSAEGADHITGFFLTPIWRMENNSTAIKPYFELGIGPGRISETKFRRKNRTTPLDKISNFQFEVLLGGGFRFGQSNQYEIGIHWSHYSNGYTKRPNYTLDHIQLSFGYRF